MTKLKQSNGRLPLALDLDGVTFNTFKIVHREANKINNTNVKYKDLTVYPLYPKIGDSQLQISDLFEKVWTKKSHTIELMDPGIPCIIERLSEHFEINITTCAAKGNPLATQSIKATLERHGVIFDNFYHLTSHTQKAELGMFVYIEDDCRVIRNNQGHVILVSQPWVLEHIKTKGTSHSGKEILIEPKAAELKRSNGHRHDGSERFVVLSRSWQHIEELLLEGLIRD